MDEGYKVYCGPCYCRFSPLWSRLPRNNSDPVPGAGTAHQIRRTDRTAGCRTINMLRWARNHSCKDPVNLIEAIFSALDEQTVTVIGTEVVELVISRVATQIKELKHQRAIVAEEVEKLLDDFPLSQVLVSMPGIGIKTAATILLTIGDAGIQADLNRAFNCLLPDRAGNSPRIEVPERRVIGAMPA